MYLLESKFSMTLPTENTHSPTLKGHIAVQLVSSRIGSYSIKEENMLLFV